MSASQTDAARPTLHILDPSSSGAMVVLTFVNHFGRSAAVGQHASCGTGWYILFLKKSHAAHDRQQAGGML